jgi:hypothetical protein
MGGLRSNSLSLPVMKHDQSTYDLLSRSDSRWGRKGGVHPKDLRRDALVNTLACVLQPHVSSSGVNADGESTMAGRTGRVEGRQIRAEERAAVRMDLRW